MRGRIQWDWRDIDRNTQRTKVIGGWIVKTTEDVHHVTGRGDVTYGYDWRVSTCFVPDPNHLWEIVK